MKYQRWNAVCGESRMHGVEWGKTRRLFHRVTSHYKIAQFRSLTSQSTKLTTKKRLKFSNNTGRQNLIGIGWNIETYHCLKWKRSGGDFFDNRIFDIGDVLYRVQIKSRRGNNRNVARASY